MKTLAFGTSGKVAKIEIESAGVYPRESPPEIHITNPPIGRRAKARVSQQPFPGGPIRMIEVTEPGTGYEQPPVVTIAPPPSGNPEHQATARAVLGVEIKLLEGIESVRERVIEALRLLQGEWFVDPRLGIDYQGILGRRSSIAYIQGVVIQTVEDVQDVVSATITRVTEERGGRLRIALTVETIYGTTQVETPLPLAA